MHREWKGVPPWHWKELRAYFPERKTPFLKKLRKGGRPRADERLCFDAILWSARSGLSLRRLPARFGSPRTAARRLARWRRDCTLDLAWKRYLWNAGDLEREEWRRDLDDACRRSPAFWRLELQAMLKSVIIDSCAESSPWLGGLTPPN